MLVRAGTHAHSFRGSSRGQRGRATSVHLLNPRLLPLQVLCTGSSGHSDRTQDPGAPRGGARLGPRRPRGPQPSQPPSPETKPPPAPGRGGTYCPRVRRRRKGPGGSARSGACHCTWSTCRSGRQGRHSTQSTGLQACVRGRPGPSQAQRGAPRTTPQRGLPKTDADSAPPPPPTLPVARTPRLCGARQPGNHVGPGHSCGACPRSHPPGQLGHLAFPERCTWLSARHPAVPKAKAPTL